MLCQPAAPAVSARHIGLPLPAESPIFDGIPYIGLNFVENRRFSKRGEPGAASWAGDGEPGAATVTRDSAGAAGAASWAGAAGRDGDDYA